MDFLSTILSWIESAYDIIKPCYVLNEYEGAVVLRFGKKKSVPEPGFHWKWPIVDELLTCHIATETISVESQSLTTSDDKNIIVSGVVKCSVVDPAVYLIKVKDVSNAISDIAQGEIKQCIMARTWDQCRKPDLDNEITIKVRREAKKWGIQVEFVTLTSLQKTISLRIVK